MTRTTKNTDAKFSQTQKVGRSKDQPRVTIWNRRIETLAGFEIGSPIDIEKTKSGSLVITAGDEQSTRRVARVKNHGNVLPVIDVKGTLVSQFGSHVDVTFVAGTITIS